MENGPKIAIGATVVVIAAFGIRVGLDYKARHDDAAAPVATASSPAVDPDDNVYLKKEQPDSLKDERDMIGRTVWISAGGQLDYYKDTGKHIDYKHPVGPLLSNEPLLIKEVFEEVAPNSGSSVFRIAAGKRQVLLGFTMPKSADTKALYAMVVGNFDNGYNLFNDELFFYDDPHKLYDYWGPATWAHIDAHEPVLGMSERQVMMTVGQVQTPHGGTYGNRSVTYDNSGHPLDIDYEHDKAIKITKGSE
jgi:hypothetical protein